VDSRYQTGKSCQLRLLTNTESGPNAAPATAGMIKNASTSATWILSGSTHQGEASEDFRRSLRELFFVTRLGFGLNPPNPDPNGTLSQFSN